MVRVMIMTTRGIRIDRDGDGGRAALVKRGGSVGELVKSQSLGFL